MVKQPLFSASLFLLVSCNGQQGKTTAPQMDPDFVSTEPHPFVSRTETATGETLSIPQSYSLECDTIGSIVIQRADTCFVNNLLHTFSYKDSAGGSGNVSCQYNEFNELTDLWIESTDHRVHSMIQWDEEGNLQSVHQESWTQASAETEAVHTMTFIQYSYTQHSGYGNWYAGMAEQIGGPISEALHRGLLGRSPWTLPDQITYVCSDIRGDMIGEQTTHRCQLQYDYDNNGRVTTERLIQPQQTQTYSYTY